MIILNIGNESELFEAVKEHLSFLGFDYTIKKAWTEDLLKECISHDYEFASGHYMAQVRKMNLEQALAFVQENPKVLRKFIVIDEERHKAVADFPKLSTVRKVLKKTFGRR